jgi:hypothetical protein
MTFAFGGAAFAEGEELAEPGVRRAGAGVDEEFEAGGLGEAEAAADEKGDVAFLGLGVGADDPGERVGVGDCEGVIAEIRGALDELVGMTGAGEEGEVGGDGEFGVGGGLAG